MAKRFHPPSNKAQHYARFVKQKLLVEKYFPSFQCHLNRGLLECIGTMCPTEFSEAYKLRLRYTEWGIPEVRILKPKIIPNAKIHMYRNGDLCLYHPPTQPWSSTLNLHETIIPWTAEWLVFYELFLSEGKWLGPEVSHDVI